MKWLLILLSLAQSNGPSDTTRWAEIYKSPSEVIKMDAHTIRKEKEGVKELTHVWFKHYKIDTGSEARPNEIYFMKFDCNDRKFALKILARYSYLGEIIEEKYTLDAGLMPVIPDSRVESLMLFACEWVERDEERRNQSKSPSPSECNRTNPDYWLGHC